MQLSPESQRKRGGLVCTDRTFILHLLRLPKLLPKWGADVITNARNVQDV